MRWLYRLLIAKFYNQCRGRKWCYMPDAVHIRRSDDSYWIRLGMNGMKYQYVQLHKDDVCGWYQGSEIYEGSSTEEFSITVGSRADL